VASTKNRGPVTHNLPEEKDDDEGVDEWHDYPFYRHATKGSKMGCQRSAGAWAWAVDRVESQWRARATSEGATVG
jgi:hypothetical protein